MNRNARLGIIVAAAAATGWLAQLPAPDHQASAGSPIQAGNTDSPLAAKPAPTRFAALPERIGMGEPGADLFGPHSWAPPAQPPKPQPAAAPVPPPLPYKFAGMVAQGGAAQLLLVRGDRVFPAIQGETLDGSYRVQSVSAEEIVLVYLPLNARQSVPVSSAIGLGETITPDARAPRAASPAAGSVAAAGGAAPQATAASTGGPAQLRWEGPQQVRAGSNFSVALRVTSGEPLRGSPMQLRFDASVLQPVGARPGKFFAGDRNFSYRANPDGSIFVGVSGGENAVAADAELLVLTFRPLKADATAEIRIASLNLHGPSGRALAFDAPPTYRAVVVR